MYLIIYYLIFLTVSHLDFFIDIAITFVVSSAVNKCHLTRIRMQQSWTTVYCFEKALWRSRNDRYRISYLWYYSEKVKRQITEFQKVDNWPLLVRSVINSIIMGQPVLYLTTTPPGMTSLKQCNIPQEKYFYHILCEICFISVLFSWLDFCPHKPTVLFDRKNYSCKDHLLHKKKCLWVCGLITDADRCQGIHMWNLQKGRPFFLNLRLFS